MDKCKNREKWYGGGGIRGYRETFFFLCFWKGQEDKSYLIFIGIKFQKKVLTNFRDHGKG